MKDNRYFCSMIRREIFKGVNSIKFYNRFKNDDDCLRYMSESLMKVSYAKDAAIRHTIKAGLHTPVAATSANVMRA